MKRKIRTVLFSSLLIALSLFPIFVYAQEQAKHYVDNGKCKLCHNIPHNGKQYTICRSKPHANAFDTLFEKKARRFADERGIALPPYEAPECLKCHVTGYDVKTRSVPKELKADDGVQCGSCHGPGSAHMQDGKLLRMNKGAKVDLRKNILMPNNQTCIACHNEESPPWNPKKYTLESGEKTGFDFERAVVVIAHPNPNRSSRTAAALRKAAASPWRIDSSIPNK